MVNVEVAEGVDVRRKDKPVGAEKVDRDHVVKGDHKPQEGSAMHDKAKSQGKWNESARSSHMYTIIILHTDPHSETPEAY